MYLNPKLGIFYIPNWLSEKEETDLVQTIDANPWSEDLKRRTQQYGFKYDYTKKLIDPSMRLGPLPDFLESHAARLECLGVFDKKLDQAIINEYLPGQGIGEHTDCVTCFDDTIFSISLLSSCVIRLRNKNKDSLRDILLAPRSLLVLTGEARWKWTHQIEATKTDLWSPRLLPRSRRVSVTFRKVLLHA